MTDLSIHPKMSFINKKSHIKPPLNSVFTSGKYKNCSVIEKITDAVIFFIINGNINKFRGI